MCTASRHGPAAHSALVHGDPNAAVWRHRQRRFDLERLLPGQQLERELRSGGTGPPVRCRNRGRLAGESEAQTPHFNPCIRSPPPFIPHPPPTVFGHLLVEAHEAQYCLQLSKAVADALARPGAKRHKGPLHDLLAASGTVARGQLAVLSGIRPLLWARQAGNAGGPAAAARPHSHSSWVPPTSSASGVPDRKRSGLKASGSRHQRSLRCME